MKKIKKLFLLVPILLIPIFAPVYAAVSQEGWSLSNYTGTGLPNPEGGIQAILLKFIDWAIIIIGLLCIVIFIYAGFLYLTAQGETDKIETAKKVMIYAVVGVVVSVLGLVVVYTVDMILRANGGTGTGAGAPVSAPASAGSTTPAIPPTGSSGGQMPVAPGMMGGQ